MEKLDLTVDIEEMERIKAFVLSVSHQADLGEVQLSNILNVDNQQLMC